MSHAVKFKGTRSEMAKELSERIELRSCGHGLHINELIEITTVVIAEHIESLEKKLTAHIENTKAHYGIHGHDNK